MAKNIYLFKNGVHIKYDRRATAAEIISKKRWEN